jgi:hypothetical protein
MLCKTSASGIIRVPVLFGKSIVSSVGPDALAAAEITQNPLSIAIRQRHSSSSGSSIAATLPLFLLCLLSGTGTPTARLEGIQRQQIDIGYRTQ